MDDRRVAWLLVFWASLALILPACSATDAAPGTPESSGAGEPAILRFYNWDTYIDPQILANFEQQYNVAIDYQIYDSDIDMLEELRAGATDQYDLVVPSDFNVTIMRNEDLLAPLNKDNIPNLANIQATFVNPVFDPANRHCAPYQWGTVGIGYNIKTTGREIKGWSDFFDPAFAGRVAMLDDYRTTMGIVLLILGYSPNTTNSGQIAEAAEFLKLQANQISAYTGDDGQDLLVAGEYDMVVEWSGDIFQVMEDNPDIRYVIPEEGSIIWTDNICIPADAPHKELAESFINYLLEPAVGAALSNYVQYATPNQAALPFINEEDLNNPAIYPPDEVRQRLFFLIDVNLAADAIYEDTWTDILANHAAGNGSALVRDILTAKR